MRQVRLFDPLDSQSNPAYYCQLLYMAYGSMREERVIKPHERCLCGATTALDRAASAKSHKANTEGEATNMDP